MLIGVNDVLTWWHSEQRVMYRHYLEEDACAF
jgi:hypothetical protein